MLFYCRLKQPRQQPRQLPGKISATLPQLTSSIKRMMILYSNNFVQIKKRIEKHLLCLSSYLPILQCLFIKNSTTPVISYSLACTLSTAVLPSAMDSAFLAYQNKTCGKEEIPECLRFSSIF